MNFGDAFKEMLKGKWVKCMPGMATLYSIQDGVFSIKISEYSKAGKQNYYITRTLQPADPSTLFVKQLLSETWEITE